MSITKDYLDIFTEGYEIGDTVLYAGLDIDYVKYSTLSLKMCKFKGFISSFKLIGKVEVMSKNSKIVVDAIAILKHTRAVLVEKYIF